MSDSTALLKQSSLVDSADPFERELQKKIRNRAKKLEKIVELEKKIKKKEIVPNEEQLEKINSKDAVQAEIDEIQSYIDLFKASQQATLQKEKETAKSHAKALQQSKA